VQALQLAVIDRVRMIRAARQVRACTRLLRESLNKQREKAMFSTPVVIGSILTYLLMLAAYYIHRPRAVHVTVMSLCMLFDACIPFYLYFARNWPHLLIDKGEILDFLVWMHVGLDILLFTLYFLQVRDGLRLWKGDVEARTSHAQQAKVILAVRILVVLSGVLLAPR
jgi:hypothetical protein